MHLADHQLVLSPTDLTAFSACGHRTWLDRARVAGLIGREPRVEDLRLDLLKQRGIEHEERYLEQLEAGGERVRRFGQLEPDERNPDGYRRRHDETVTAMREGYDVVYQGTLYEDGWLGFVDFLLRVETPSALGAWSYEVVDAKLAREAKAAAVIQTSTYSDLLGRAQGARPERIHLYLGGPTPGLVSFRLAHFAAYQRSLVARLGAHLEAIPDALPVAPDPVELCRMCDWRPRCRRERVAADHLSLVAGITRDQRRTLDARGVTTLEALATLPIAPPPAGLRARSFERVREQARIQLEGRRRGEPVHELLPLEPGPSDSALGLAALPAPHAQDLFFDFEGADYAGEDGLEYLWGITDVNDAYRSRWALTPDEEKAALVEFLADTERHVAAHPGAHVYHFGHYEPTALKRLVGRYGVGTEALDRLLKQRVFVDLHRVVRQGVRASVESYSLKALEEHFGFERDVPLDEANPARTRLEYALALSVGPDDEALQDRPAVEAYNRDDCISTRALRDWLEELRATLEAERGEPIPRPAPKEAKDDGEAEQAESTEVAELMGALLDGVSEVRDERSDAEHVRWLVAHLLDWHRREDKTAWWDYFRLRELGVDELIEETTPLAGLEYQGIVGTVKRSEIHRFSFPPQEHRIDAGKRAKEPSRVEGELDTGRLVWAIDDGECWIDLKVGRGTEFDPEALQVLLRDDVVGTKDQRARLRRAARCLIDGEEALRAWSPVAYALLRAETPRLRDGRTLADLEAATGLTERAVQAGLVLDEGVLPIQGPPGTGKTHTGARMIRAFLRDGLRVGVTGPSHKVITNLLDAVFEADEDDEATDVVGVQVGEGEGCADERVTSIGSSSGARRAIDGRADEGEAPFNLIAGTAWLWARDDMEREVDVLFI